MRKIIGTPWSVSDIGGQIQRRSATQVSVLAMVVAGICFATSPVRAEEAAEPEPELVAQEVDGGANESGQTTFRDSATVAPIAVTATRHERSLLETAGNVDVIDREDIQQTGGVTIQNLFRYKAGIEVPVQSSATDPFSSNGGIEIRGVGGNRTQILVDGNRTLERITDNTRDIVEASNVKAVEIVRGPSSVLWGSDALGGVVNFITRDPSDLLIGGVD